MQTGYRIAIDQDQVLADLLVPWLERYNEEYNDNLKPEDIKKWEFHDLVKPECGKKIYTYLDDWNLFRNLPVIENSQEVVKELLKYYEVFIVTASRNKNNITAKVEWLREHFPFVEEKNYVFTQNKSIINADWMIDDKLKNFENFKGIGLLFDAPHNKDVSNSNRMKDWEQVEKYFLWF